MSRGQRADSTTRHQQPCRGMGCRGSPNAEKSEQERCPAPLSRSSANRYVGIRPDLCLSLSIAEPRSRLIPVVRFHPSGKVGCKGVEGANLETDVRLASLGGTAHSPIQSRRVKPNAPRRDFYLRRRTSNGPSKSSSVYDVKENPSVCSGLSCCLNL